MLANPEEILRLLGILCAGLFFLAFGAGGVFLTISYFRNKQKTSASQNWSSTQGIIHESSVRESSSNDSDGPPTYFAHIRYTYQVLGQPYQGKNIHIGARSAGSRSKAQQVVDRFPPGSTVSVFYDPSNPADAVLERSSPANTVTLILGVIFLLITLCILCGGLISIIANLTAGSGI